MIRLTEVCELLDSTKTIKRKYTLREVYINPEHIISLREDPLYEKKMLEGHLPKGLDSRQRFTRLTLSRGNTGMEIVVVGATQIIQDNLEKFEKERRILHG